jgi:hypothetical protein
MISQVGTIVTEEEYEGVSDALSLLLMDPLLGDGLTDVANLLLREGIERFKKERNTAQA